MKMMIMKISLWLLLLGLETTYTAAGPGSCVGRCGETFTRGQQCACDFSCLQHNECCQDFQAVCTTGHSCKGRCGEIFRRGQLCECDPLCIQYNTCCQDYQHNCGSSVSDPHSRTLRAMRASTSEKRKSKRGRKHSNSESEEWLTARGPCHQNPGVQCSRFLSPHNPQTAGFSSPVSPDRPTTLLPFDFSNTADGPLPLSIPSFQSPASHATGPFFPSYGVQFLDSSPPVSPSGLTANGGAENVHLVQSPGEAASSLLSQDLSGSADPGPRPSTLQDVAQASGLSLMEGGPGGPVKGVIAGGALCSDSPISGITALSNGTILIFKGKLFWSVDPKSHSVGQPLSILGSFGILSSIDTVFTRCNCQGNTYIIQGHQFWRLDSNMMMESGYPKPLASEFPGLTGGITAALAIPATRDRPELVFFFKKGDIMQRFIFPPSSTPSCSKRPSPFTKQPAVPLSGEISLHSPRIGFPLPVTSALSLPIPLKSDPYQHYIFSGPLFFSITISSDMPVLAKPELSAAIPTQSIFSPAAMAPNPANMAAQDTHAPYPVNSIKVWLGCP
ncbi:proteoglycan 4a [Xyrichtys novacula]|uniref:Proteoglycan 4a n=1 Tax=Xyrichtys novacula TaxID=13765 RepID=A0AAV1GE09_XYRNO|nr:proteoglycan 4a [Xyrichtys novacula]